MKLHIDRVQHGTSSHSYRFGRAAGMLLMLASSLAWSSDWLISPAEIRAEAGAVWSVPKFIPQPGAPKITIITPNDVQHAKTPLDFQLEFKAQQGAMIDPASFRVLYGAFQMDITDRILKYGKLDEQGIQAHKLAISPGKYVLRIQVADNAKRIGQAELILNVE